MPETKCHLGHTQHVSTTDWVATLTLDLASILAQMGVRFH